MWHSVRGGGGGGVAVLSWPLCVCACLLFACAHIVNTPPSHFSLAPPIACVPQGDRERDLGIKISFGCDRDHALPLEKSQAGFIAGFVMPCYRLLGRVPGIDCSVRDAGVVPPPPRTPAPTAAPTTAPLVASLFFVLTLSSPYSLPSSHPTHTVVVFRRFLSRSLNLT